MTDLELKKQLNNIKLAIAIIATRVSNDLGTDDIRRINELLSEEPDYGPDSRLWPE